MFSGNCSVMAGLVPAISIRRAVSVPERDARDKPAHDSGEDPGLRYFPMPASLMTLA
jgi:hypothetical protein